MSGYKQVPTDKGHMVTTPWLRPAEAAAYCSISRSQFDATSGVLPSGGQGRTRTYHTAVLDAWIAAGYPSQGLGCDAQGAPLSTSNSATPASIRSAALRHPGGG